jgi:hypothetical protein
VIGAAFSPPPEGSHLNGDAAHSSYSSDVKSGQLLLRSHGFLCLVDLAAPLPTHARIHPQTHLAARNDLARRTRVKQQRANHLKYLARAAAAQEAAASAAAAADGGDGSGGGLSAAALSQGASSALKRQRSNSTGSVTSTTSASEFITSGSGNGNSGLTPARRLRSDSVTSAGSDHLGGGGGGSHGQYGGSSHHGGGEGADEEEVDDLNNDLNRNFAITLKYRPVLFADYLGPGELLVVEEPWLKIMQRLPDPLFRQRFGT